MTPDPSPRRPSYWRRLRRQKQEILSVRADAVRRRTPLERLLAAVARRLAHPAFFAAEAALHLVWVALNAGWVAGVRPWDPYPFPLLAGIDSMQALGIALLILMHQERDARVAELREETELQVALHDERETTKLLRMMRELHDALGVRGAERNEELDEMSEPLDPQRLRESLETRLRDADP